MRRSITERRPPATGSRAGSERSSAPSPAAPVPASPRTSQAFSVSSRYSGLPPQWRSSVAALVPPRSDAMSSESTISEMSARVSGSSGTRDRLAARERLVEQQAARRRHLGVARGDDPAPRRCAHRVLQQLDAGGVGEVQVVEDEALDRQRLGVERRAHRVEEAGAAFARPGDAAGSPSSGSSHASVARRARRASAGRRRATRAAGATARRRRRARRRDARRRRRFGRERARSRRPAGSCPCRLRR